MSLCFIYIQSFYRLCVCLPSPCHAVIIRLLTKQYYLFVYFLEFSKRVSPKLITQIFQNINSENTNALKWCCAWLSNKLLTLLSVYSNIFFQINNRLSGYYVHKSQGVTITLSQIRYQHFGLPWQMNVSRSAYHSKDSTGCPNKNLTLIALPF